MASDEVVTPWDIRDLKSALVKAVINGYMSSAVPQGWSLNWDGGGCADGEFRYQGVGTYSPPNAHSDGGFSPLGDKDFSCSWPGGVWKQDGGDVDAEAAALLPDARDIFDTWEEAVDGWIDPWVQSPSPNVYTNQITSVANIAKQLYIDDEIHFGGEVTPIAEGDNREGDDTGGGSVTSAVSDIRTAVDEMKISVDDLGGLAIDAFQRTYVADISRTIGGQRGLATAAGIAITAEAVAWNEAFTTMRDFVNDATHDFDQLADVTGGRQTEATLTAVSAVAGLAGSTAGVAFPPFGVAMGVVASVATVARLMFPDEPAVEPAPVRLEGGEFYSYWDSFQQQIEAISGDLGEAEQAISRGCQRMLGDYEQYPDNYSLTRGTGNGQGAQDDLAPFLQSQIDFDETKMRNVAGAVESIGDHQLALARTLGGTDLAGNPSSQVADEWERGSLPGRGPIGMGATGPYADYSALVEALVDLLIGEQRTAHRVAEHCIDVASDFTATDAEREAELNELARGFDTVDFHRV